MSEIQKHGYGKDLRLRFGTDGEMDLVISSTGDLDIVGGTGKDTYQSRVENAAQQIKVRIMTPFNSMRDESGNPIPIGSILHTLIGRKMNDMSGMLLKSGILASVMDLPFIARVIGIDFVTEDKEVTKSSHIKILMRYTLKEDNQVYYITTDFNESVV